ncbi:MAG TPA: 2OG-Fe(II) oxygenase [Sphingomicrobium sp.]|nr:2OG-Fe(II) oxygenase [Sphingomicrobium sp.]
MAGRDQEAVRIIRELAAAGDRDALFMLAEMTWRGGLVDQDSYAARRLYETARGHRRAEAYATNLLASGIAGPRDWQAALRRLKSEAARDPVRRRTLDLIKAMDLDAKGDPRSVPEAQALSETPFAILFPKLVSAAECRYLIALAEPTYQPSMVYDDQRQLVRDPIRTSDGSTVHWLIEDPAVQAVNRRIAAASGTAYEAGETLQSLRYFPGQEYRPHFDFVPGDNQRLWTALIYLNDDYEGGETEFVRTGLKVRGSRGDVLLFRSATEQGELEPLSEHAGLPVTSGVKYLATRWIREKRWIP